MATVDLQKIRITGLKKHYKLLMQELHKGGLLEIVENDDFVKNSIEAVDEHFEVFDLARIEFVINFLLPYESKKSKLDSIFSGGKLVLSEKESKDRVKKFGPISEEIISECEDIAENIIILEKEISKLQAKSVFLLPLKQLRIKLRDDLNTKSSSTIIGTITLKKENAFLQKLAKISHLIDVQTLGKSSSRLYLRLTTFGNFDDQLDEIIKLFEFNVLDFSDLEEFFGNTPREILRILEKNEQESTSNLNKFKNKRSELAKHLDDLRILSDYNSWKKTKHDLQFKILKTKKIFAFEAWIPKEESSRTADWVKKSFANEVSVEEIKSNKNEIIPVLIKNKKGFSSFEPITEMFGTPDNDDIDPTPYLTPFFFVFFGLCLSDVGYGGILTLVALTFLIFGKFSTAAKDGIRLLLFCGIGATIGGIILGGYFGMSPDMVPSFLSFLLTPEFLSGVPEAIPFRGQLFDPMSGDGPITFLKLSLALGITHLLFGLLLDFFKRIKNKDIMGALCDPLPWFFTLLMTVGFVLADIIGLDKELFKNLIIAGAILLVMTQGREQKNWLLKPIFGVLGLYNITGYLSDLLSYSRIMALGLATGVIGFAMNLTAGVLYEMMPHPVLGVIVAVLILLGGHGLNFSLSLLGAFVHSGRLQFIEFFSKFFGGNGKKFTPFVRKKRYLFFRN